MKMPKRKWDKLRDDEAIEREKKHRTARIRDRSEAQAEIDESWSKWEQGRKQG
jgi:hypothetical protein